MYLNRSTPTSDLISVNFLLNFHGMSRGQEKHPDDIVRKQQGVGYAEQSLWREPDTLHTFPEPECHICQQSNRDIVFLKTHQEAATIQKGKDKGENWGKLGKTRENKIKCTFDSTVNISSISSQNSSTTLTL